MFADPLITIAAVLVAVMGVGRLARVLTYDDFPPAIWARMTWDRLTRDGAWSKLAHCFWCLTPWIMAVCMAWFWLAALYGLSWTWWVFWGWLGLSYVSSMIVARDEPPA